MNEMIIADPLKSLDFLECMFGPEGTLHLIAISEGEPPEAKSFVPEQRRALLLWVQQREGRSNIYFAANRLADGFMNRKAKKENVVAALMLHVDVDDPDALERVSAFTPKPTAVVFSGGGYQAFWLLKEPTKEVDPNLVLALSVRADAAGPLRLRAASCVPFEGILSAAV